MTNQCNDKNCPVHGGLTIKGAAVYGTVVSDKMAHTATVQWARKLFIPKYERYQARLSKIKVHNPACIDAKTGDYVKLRETRPLSKTKHFVIVEVLGKKGFVQIKHEELLTKHEKEALKEKVEAKKKSKTEEVSEE